MQEITERGLVLLGCGKMGSALLKGWLEAGAPVEAITVLAPRPSEWLRSTGVHINTALPDAPAIVVLGVKPQIMADAIAPLTRFGGADTLFVSVAAGLTLARYAEMLGPQTPVIRAMPNTPSAIGRGMTGVVGNAHVSEAQLAVTEQLLSAVGQVVRLEDEAQMPALAAISGCGPAYVFHLIEAMAEAGTQAGLPADLALHLARATVAGAGDLAESAAQTPSELRENVTSPNGVTAEALRVLMDEETGFRPLLTRAINAAIRRDQELSQ